MQGPAHQAREAERCSLTRGAIEQINKAMHLPAGATLQLPSLQQDRHAVEGGSIFRNGGFNFS